jgi:hypothetical protein
MTFQLKIDPSEIWPVGSDRNEFLNCRHIDELHSLQDTGLNIIHLQPPLSLLAGGSPNVLF